MFLEGIVKKFISMPSDYCGVCFDKLCPHAVALDFQTVGHQQSKDWKVKAGVASSLVCPRCLAVVLALRGVSLAEREVRHQGHVVERGAFTMADLQASLDEPEK